MNRLLQRLLDPTPLLLDGGLGTMLISRGLAPGSPPEAWVLERPEELLAVHRAYVDAGSDVVHTATFGANAIRLERFGLSDRAEEIQLRAAELARASGAAWVFADLGPTGEYLPPVGTGDPLAWREAYDRQVQSLRATPIDAIHLETFTDLREALIALEAARSGAPEIPVLASLTFERRPRGYFTIMGDQPRPAWQSLIDAGASVVGANCSLTSDEVAALVRIGSDARFPLVVPPNAGRPDSRGEAFVYAQAPEEFAADMASVAAIDGIKALGGCCGTDPRFIAALRARLHPGRPWR